MSAARCEVRRQPEVPAIDIGCLTDIGSEGLAGQFRNAEPFPHIAVDDLFPPDVLDAVSSEIDGIAIDPEKHFYSTFHKRRISDFSRLPPTARQLISDLNSAKFIEFLERITGIEGLIPDPFLEGGGLHQIGPGGFLKIHTDFNFHAKMKLHRRLNLLIYLNRDWKEEWGGALELWDAEMQQCRARYFPNFNRMVVFATTDSSYHGHPDPLACPSDVRRNSIALYYYTVDRPASEVRFTRSTMTNYQQRPAERFSSGRLHHLVNQLEIRHPALHKFLALLRRVRAGRAA